MRSLQNSSFSFKKIATLVGTVMALTLSSHSTVHAQKTLKLAHQWPAPQGDKGDNRSLWADKFADKVAELSDGALKIEVYAGNSLIGPSQQWNALGSGALDMAIIVPSYFSGQVPEFDGLNMMGIVNSNDDAYAFSEGPGGEVMQGWFQEHNTRMLGWKWEPETIGYRKANALVPNDLKGLKMRGPGAAIEKVFAASGASISSIPSSDLYTALQTGALDGCLTTFSSIESFHLYESLSHVIVSPSEGGLLYAMTPLIISENTWQNLESDDREILEEASAQLEPWLAEVSDLEAKDNAAFFKEEGVEIHKLSEEEFEEWMGIARPIVDQYASLSSTAEAFVKHARDLTEK